MAVETTYSNLRQHLAATLDQVADDREVVIVRRRAKGGVSRDIALVPAHELQGLLETAHLLRSPRNAARLLTALRRAERRQGKAQNLASLKREMGLESE